MRAQAYALVRRVLSQETRNRLKAWRREARRRAAPLIRRIYGTFGPNELEANLAAHLPAAFDILMVHSSMDDLYPMFRGTAFDVLAVLRRLAGERTLAMPAYVLGSESFEPARRYEADPVFNVARTPSETGLVTELFRRSRNVRRSLHPTHSLCAAGPLAEALTAGHHLAERAFGAGSPYERMDHYRTVILGVGTDYFRSLAHIMTAEDLLGAAFPGRPAALKETPTVLIAADGSEIPYTLKTVPHEAQGRLRLDRLRAMMPPGELQEWRFHGAPFFAVEAAAITRALLDHARRGITLYDPA
jgi:aminoglycoside 3-N-acetyltransferase